MEDNAMSGDTPKIFIDEDWKAQVQREKEEAKVAPSDEPDKAAAEEEASPVEATFAGHLQSLAAQCAFALGLIAPPDSKQVMVDLDEARFCIDTLSMLRVKTKGNLTPEEEGMLTQILGQLQQAYVVRAQQVQESALKQSGIRLDHPQK
jgi:hypothetical protein